MKRQTNTAGLKVKFLPATNEKPNRLRITQMNCGKSVTAYYNQTNNSILEFVCNVLEGTEQVENFSLVVDNTQDDYYLFSVKFTGNEFINILSNFKK